MCVRTNVIKDQAAFVNGLNGVVSKSNKGADSDTNDTK